MKALIVVAHSPRSAKKLQEILYKHGLKKANPSKRYGLTPDQITKRILKANNIPFNETYRDQEIKVGKIWNELTLDLFLANIDEELWGWTENSSIFFLNHWKQAEPNIKFLLTYENPNDFFLKELNDSKIDEKKIKDITRKYTEYYEMMIDFYHRNKDSSLLAHTRTTETNYKKFSKEIEKLTGKTFDFKKIEGNNEHKELVEKILISEILAPHKTLNQTYETLEMIADIPELFHRHGEAQRKELIKELNSSIKSRQEKDIKKTYTLEGIKKEKAEITNQLYHYQEKLEEYYLIEKATKNNATKVNNKKRLSMPYYGAEERVKKQLSYRLGRAMIENSQTVEGWLSMPRALLRQKKEFKKDLEQWKRDKLPPISYYEDAHEAERIKKHLSYRLGKVLIDNTKPFFKIPAIPWLLKKEISNFKKEKK